MMGCLQRSWNDRVCSKLIWPIKNEKRLDDEFGALAGYIYRSSWVFPLLYRHPGMESKRNMGTVHVLGASFFSRNVLALMPWLEEKKTKIVCISCYGHSRSTLPNALTFYWNSEKS